MGLCHCSPQVGKLPLAPAFSRAGSVPTESRPVVHDCDQQADYGKSSVSLRWYEHGNPHQNEDFRPWQMSLWRHRPAPSAETLPSHLNRSKTLRGQTCPKLADFALIAQEAASLHTTMCRRPQMKVTQIEAFRQLDKKVCLWSLCNHVLHGHCQRRAARKRTCAKQRIASSKTSWRDLSRIPPSFSLCIAFVSSHVLCAPLVQLQVYVQV